MAITPRDEKVVIHLGYHHQLSQEQIEKLEFPSYHTFQRRWRDCYSPEAEHLFEEPVYMDLYGDGRSVPIYRLARKGRDLFELRTGESAKKRQFSFRYTPHLIETNDMLIGIKAHNYKTKKSRFSPQKGLIGIGDFEIEKQVGNKQVDVLVNFPQFYLAVEIDLSEKDWDSEIKTQFESYVDIFRNKQFDKPLYLMYYTNREEKIQTWISEVTKKYNKKILFCPRNPNFVKRYIRIIKNTIDNKSTAVV